MKNLFLFSVIALLAGCQSTPRPIAYGEDMCVYCKMAIVDNQHAALAMTDKGKTFKFDAIECLIPFLETQNETTYKTITVTDYKNPGVMLPANESTYLISQSIPSPMGAFLTAFQTREQAQSAQQTGGGELYSWEEIRSHLQQ